MSLNRLSQFRGQLQRTVLERWTKRKRRARFLCFRSATSGMIVHAKVSTMVLSETLGLSLFSVIRGGIELTKRLECLSTCKVYERVGYSPSNERFENQFASSRHDPEIGLGSRH